MTRPLCTFAGPIVEDRWRECGHPDRGGRCRRLVECRDCPLHTSPDGTPTPPAAPAPARKSLPCLHLGAPARPPDGESVVRKWVVCEAGLGTVCTCRCGPKCDRYEPDGPEQEQEAGNK